ncbi:type II secretion system GspH family protein [Oligoflexia bacterium]|nr:type II secretion system GspH family protein [Oligoflexia bacterium]
MCCKRNQTDINRRRKEAGFALMEVLVSIVIASLAATGVALSLSTALKVEKLTEVHLAASTLASSKIEQLASIDPLNLDATDNSTETAVTFPGLNMTFTRTVTVTVNVDDSRTLAVDVSSNNDGIPSTVDFVTTFALWE